MTQEQIVRWHFDNHGSWPQEECWRCLHNQYVCRSKLTYETAQDAHEAMKLRNEEESYQKPCVPYRCRYCDHWHATSKLSKHRRKRAERQRRRWLTQKEVARREQEQHEDLLQSSSH